MNPSAVCLALLLVLVGCGASPAPVVRTDGVASNGNGNGAASSPPVARPAPDGRTPIPLAPGFSPRPTVARGVAGGPNDAGTFDPACIGMMPQRPQHVLEITSPIPYLAIGAYSAGDLTIAVHLPDGTWRCNDDWDGLNPLVMGAVGAGRVEVYVGTYSESEYGSQGENGYTVGFSEDPGFTPSALASM